MYKSQLRLKLAQGKINENDIYIPRRPTAAQSWCLRWVARQDVLNGMRKRLERATGYKPSMGTMRRRLRVAAADV